jgi:pilus assembly protein CpaB
MLAFGLVFGLLAVFATKTWLDAQRAAIAAQGRQPAVTTQTIVVAKEPLRFGMLLQPQILREIPWSSDTIPDGAFRTVAEMLNEQEGERYVINAMERNEPVLNSKITGSGQRATLSASLTEGKKAVTIRVNDVLGVAGFVLPGDRVDIMLTRVRRGANSVDEPYVDVLLQSVRVLAIDQTADDRKDDPAVVRSVTLEVDTEQAQMLTLGSSVGTLSLALRNVISDQAEETRRVTLSDLDFNVDENMLSTFDTEAESEKKAATEEAQRRPRVSTVGVSRALDRTEYKFPQ